jgi:hypothetical protein
VSAPEPPARLTPALAVVDSRNVVGAATQLLGHELKPTVEGVVRALKSYGFEALEVHVGLAVPRGRDRRELAVQFVENETYRKAIEASARGSALVGELHAKQGGKIEEKIVDVYCAVDIVKTAIEISRNESKYEAIVVLSQDIDLRPAYEFADSIGVPVYVGAQSVVQYRSEPFLMIGEHSIRTMCDPAVLCGHPLRSAIAHLANSGQTSTWTVLRYSSRRRGMLLCNAHNVLGIARGSNFGGPGASVELEAVGVDFGGDDENQFPLLECATPGTVRARSGRRARVLRRQNLHTLALRYEDDGSEVRGHYPSGYVARGSEVLTTTTDRGTVRVVGALGAGPEFPSEAISLMIRSGEPFRTLVLAVRSDTVAIGTGFGGSADAMLLHPKDRPLKVGEIYAAVVVDVNRRGPIAMISSGCLGGG